MKIISFEDETGSLTVMTESGRSLVDKNRSWELKTEQNSQPDSAMLYGTTVKVKPLT